MVVFSLLISFSVPAFIYLPPFSYYLKKCDNVTKMVLGKLFCVFVYLHGNTTAYSNYGVNVHNSYVVIGARSLILVM